MGEGGGGHKVDLVEQEDICTSYLSEERSQRAQYEGSCRDEPLSLVVRAIISHFSYLLPRNRQMGQQVQLECATDLLYPRSVDDGDHSIQDDI